MKYPALIGPLTVLACMAAASPAFAQDTVPVDYFVDILLDEPFPVTIESGRPILLRGTMEHRSVLAITALFHRFPNARRKFFFGVMSFGAFEIWIVFNHDDVGTYTMAFQTSSGGTLRFTPITVVRGPDEPELPPEALRSLGDRGYFEPAVVSLNEEFLPPPLCAGRRQRCPGRGARIG